jgi:hypothetical protein
VVFVFGLFYVLSPSFRINVVEGTVQTVIARMQPTPTEAFPNIQADGLDPIQVKILKIAKQEYNKKPVSFDANVKKYSQGHKESWCADFVSWIMLQAGRPYSNPNSGNWRIPGTATMQEYFASQNVYRQAGSYTPKVGDVALYRTNRSHVNIVIAVKGKQMTTVGGNEDGHIRINHQYFTPGTQGLSGFGELRIDSAK